MTEQLKNQYDSLYASKEVVFGRGMPNKAVTEIKNYLKQGSVLDIGGGEGRDALYLTEQGYDVTVVDISTVGIEKLHKNAQQKSVQIKTKVVDVVQDGIEGIYDAVVISFVLHHIATLDVHRLIADAKIHTNPNGVHIITTFSNEGELAKRNDQSNRFYPSETDMRTLYADWDIKTITITQTKTHARNKAGEQMKNSVVALIASKPK